MNLTQKSLSLIKKELPKTTNTSLLKWCIQSGIYEEEATDRITEIIDAAVVEQESMSDTEQLSKPVLDVAQLAVTVFFDDEADNDILKKETYRWSEERFNVDKT